MNPSSPGWITKHQPILKKKILERQPDFELFYNNLLETGFLYGVSVTTWSYGDQEPLRWTEIERTKLNFHDSLYFAYFNYSNSEAGFFEAITDFYSQLNPKEFHYLGYFKKPKPNASSLEKIIQERIQTNTPVLQKNFSNLITNALLFLDVIAFDYFLNKGVNSITFAQELEARLMNTIWLALMQKEEKEYYDKLLLKLFEKSLRYSSSLSREIQNIEDLQLANYPKLIQKKYLLDMAALAIWHDSSIDRSEYLFLKSLGKSLKLPHQTIETSANYVHRFIVNNRKKIAYFNSSNPVKHFYKQTTKTVKILILRNKKRLLQELSESKGLVLLLSQSTFRDLSKNEKKRVKTQLLSICKTVPSLAIFMLPGGGVLLPLLVKFIPELLPTAFNDNRLDDELETM